MNESSPFVSRAEMFDAAAMTRREAIKRATLLLGAALSPSFLAGVARAQSAAAAGGAPRHLTAAQFETAAAVAERIIPRTDTPGARDVGVPAFIDLMAGEFMTPAEKTLFTTGLIEVESASTAAHRKKFAALTTAQQDALLTKLAKESEKKNTSFFHQMRELTLLGYFTSEPVGKNVLHYDPVPGEYRGCVPISEVGNRAWTR